MSKHNSQIEEKIFKISLKAKSLSYNIVFVPYPTIGRFEIEPSVDNGQQTTDNRLRVWRNLSKKLYSEYNFNKSYLTKKSQGVPSCLANSYCINPNFT